MTAWWPNTGVQVLVQDPESLDLHYSYCNQGYKVVFPIEEPLKLPVKSKPRNGTALTGAGWWDGKTTWALVWYFDEFNTLAHGRYRCNPDTGKFELEKDDVISDELPSSVKLNKDSGVGAALLGETDGIRVYVHSDQNEIHSLMFTNDRDWRYEKIINPDQGRTNTAMGIGSRTGNSNEITIITPKDDKNMEETKLDPDGVCVSDREPGGSTELVGWDGNPGNIGVAIGQRSRSIYYIGTDRAIHQLDSFPTPQAGTNEEEPIDSGVWRNAASQDEGKWPLADDENANFGFAAWLDTEGGHVRIFYMVEGKLTQAIFEDNTWSSAEPVPTKIKSKNSLSDGGKAGIAVGGFFGVFALAGIVGVIVHFRRRQKRHKEHAAAAIAAATASSSTYYGGSPRPGDMAYGTPQLGQVPCVSGQSYGYGPGSEPKFEAIAVNQKPEELPVHGTYDYAAQLHEMLGEGHLSGSPPPQTEGIQRLRSPFPPQEFQSQSPPPQSAETQILPSTTTDDAHHHGQ
ncbi:hypothetical protein jhhlp_007899 [Lomentospora prolificans]|uniref:Fucose-specific lectin n=1 Tax=Lomentospora prolificans TaxID=41688 RepID=A0A2N3N0W9_9PEZI|nr:hypothetical protein jhhlp_007899 [Lomentospora prolificans]